MEQGFSDFCGAIHQSENLWKRKRKRRTKEEDEDDNDLMIEDGSGSVPATTEEMPLPKEEDETMMNQEGEDDSISEVSSDLYEDDYLSCSIKLLSQEEGIKVQKEKEEMLKNASPKERRAPMTAEDFDLMMKKTTETISYFRDLAEERTLDMYQRLLDDPEKEKTLSDDLKENIQHVKKQKQKNPKFLIADYDKDMLEFYYHSLAPVCPYGNFQVNRDKETGKRIDIGFVADHLVKRTGHHDDDKHELFLKLKEALSYHIKKYPSKDVLKTKCRMSMMKDMLALVMSTAGEKICHHGMLDTTHIFGQHIFRVKLAEERYRIIKFLWRLRAKGKFSVANPQVVEADHMEPQCRHSIWCGGPIWCFCPKDKFPSANPQVVKAYRKLFSIDEVLSYWVALPIEEESWALVPLEEQSDVVKLMERLEAEHQLIL